MSGLIRSRNSYRCLIWSRNRPFSTTRTNPKMDIDQAEQMFIANKNREKIRREFDPRTPSQVEEDEKRQRFQQLRATENRRMRDHSEASQYARATLNQKVGIKRIAIRHKWFSFKQWFWEKYIPYTRFRVLFALCFPILFGSIMLTPLYIYNYFIGEEKPIWETSIYKNRYVYNEALSNRTSWMFQDSPYKTLLRCFGFGSDWMTQMEWNERIKFFDWPWEDWFMFQLSPVNIRKREFNVDPALMASLELKSAQICPDCWRTLLYTSTVITMMALRNAPVIKMFSMFGMAVAMGGLGYASSTRNILNKPISILFGTPDVLTGNRWASFLNGQETDSDHLPAIESGDFKDKNWLAWRYQFQRDVDLTRLRGSIRIGFFTQMQMASQRYSYENEREFYIFSMEEIDDHVRDMSEPMKKALGLLNWEYGRKYPVDELIDMIEAECLGTKFLKGERYKNRFSEITPEPSKTTEENEIELYMKSLEAKFKDANKNKS